MMEWKRTAYFMQLISREDIVKNIRDKEGDSALHFAARLGDEQSLKALLSHKNIDVNLRNNQANTALHLAVSAGSIACVKQLLMQKDINVHIRNVVCYTPLGLAELLHRPEYRGIFWLLMQHHATE